MRERERVSVRELCLRSGVRDPSPDKLKMAKSMMEYRQMALQFKRKLAVARRRCADLSKIASRRFVDMVDDLAISSTARQIVKWELRNFKRKPKGRTWDLPDRLFCLAIYKRSVRAYRFLRNYLTLPCENTLKTLLQKVPLKAGISATFLKMLQRKVSTMSPDEKLCMLAFDEVYLRSHLVLNNAYINGFEDYGHRGRTNRVADHALVFMVQGLKSKWTFPVAFFFVSKCCPSDVLKLLMQDVIRALFGIGLTVCGSISDQGPNNQGAVAALRKEFGDEIL